MCQEKSDSLHSSCFSAAFSWAGGSAELQCFQKRAAEDRCSFSSKILSHHPTPHLNHIKPSVTLKTTHSPGQTEAESCLGPNLQSRDAKSPETLVLKRSCLSTRISPWGNIFIYYYYNKSKTLSQVLIIMTLTFKLTQGVGCLGVWLGEGLPKTLSQSEVQNTSRNTTFHTIISKISALAAQHPLRLGFYGCV